MDASAPVTLIVAVAAGLMLIVASIAVFWALMGIFASPSKRDPEHSLLGPVRIAEALEPEIREIYLETRTIEANTPSSKRLCAEIRRYLIELQALRISNGHAHDLDEEVWRALEVLTERAGNAEAIEAVLGEVRRVRHALAGQHEPFSQSTKCARLTE